MNRSSEEYVNEYIALAGYNPFSLPESCKQEILYYITLQLEKEIPAKYNGQNWEMDFAPYGYKKFRHEPRVEVLLRKWQSKGWTNKVESLHPIWPNNKKFALVLTHDVDRLTPFSIKSRIKRLRTFQRACVKRKVVLLGSLLKAIYKSLVDEENWVSIDEWMKIENKYQFTSSFFFISDEIGKPHSKDTFYNSDDLARWGDKLIPIGKIIRNVRQSKWSVGLHGSIESHRDKSEFIRQKQSLQKLSREKIKTSRQHYLCFDVEKTPNIHNSAGIEADSSIGSNKSSDYRAGTGLPFFMYDTRENRYLDVLQVPLIIHDVAMMVNQQMTPSITYERCCELLENTAQSGGAISLLWHNSYPVESDQVSVYRSVLERAYGLDAWGCSLSDMNSWWRKRRKCVRKWISDNR